MNSVNSGNLINHWSMNWAQFKDFASHIYLAGIVVASWSLTQEVAGWQVQALLLQRQIFLSLNSLNSVKTFRKNSNAEDFKLNNWSTTSYWLNNKPHYFLQIHERFMKPPFQSCYADKHWWKTFLLQVAKFHVLCKFIISILNVTELIHFVKDNNSKFPMR